MSWYRTGTITVTNGSPTISGAGTLWVDVGTLNPGDILYAPDGKLYEILSIASNTGITLTSNYLGTTLSAQAYSIMPIGLLPSTLAQAVKTTLANANTALASTVRYDINSMGLTLLQQQNARTNIAALSALDVGAGVLTKSVAGGVDVTLTAVEASAQYIVLTGALTASINVIVPAAARVFYVNNATSGAYTVTVKTPAGSGAVVVQGQRGILQCDGASVFNIIPQLAYITNDANGNIGFGGAPLYGSKLWLTAGASTTQVSFGIQNPGTGTAQLGYLAADSSFKIRNCYTDGLLINGKGLSISTSGDVLVTEGGGLGYGVGSGVTVTQATSKSTTVTVNKPSGKITLNNAALAANTSVQFTIVTGSITANDVVVLGIDASSIVNTADYRISYSVSNGTIYVVLWNQSGASLSQAVVINFAITKVATA